MKYSKATGQFLWLSFLLRKVTYTYDNYHNVKTATTEEGVVYSFEYDNHGNNISVSITSGTSKITSTATYSSNGNRLESTTDALGKTTTYSYNPNTHVLEWVQYPEDTEQTRTEYTYDAMYRIASAAVTTNSELTLSVNYTYEDDLLTQIETGSTTYSFDYGYFGRRNNIMVGSRALATYTYTGIPNNYLSALDYGNGDKVQYSYDKYGRLVAELYEDGETVTYKFDNNGSLATVIDSATDITTKYYYDFTDRLMKYTETGTNYSHSTAYTYDALNNLTSRKQVTDGDTFTTNYTYDDDNRLSTVANGNTTKTYSYDSYGRLCRQVTKVQDTSILSENFTFNNSTDGTSGQIKKYTSTYTGGSLAYTYTYDDNGNITSVSDGTNTTSYVYDTLNQLVRENNKAAGKTWTWTYDNAGNITSRREYAYTTGTLGTPLDTVSYGYGDADWGDLLTSYDGTTITHDTIGNPLNDGTWTYTWEHGRQLASMTSSSATWDMTYNADGLRTGRTNGTNEYTYWYNESGQLVRLKYGPLILRLSYGDNGRPISISYNGNTYYYVLNQQGDVMALLDSSGNWVVKYTYDAWGNILTTTGSTETMYYTLAQYNPLRYRGYIYDRETKLYYLQSRYYNPEVGRFINADAFPSTGQGVVGNNMFAYCGNNPVSRVDTGGYFWDTVLDVVSICFSVAEVIENPDDPMAWLGVAADVASLVVPFASGGGTIVRTVSRADDVVDTVRAVDKVDNVADAGKAISSTTKSARSSAVRKAWKNEVSLVESTGKGTRNWTVTEIDELLNTGKVKGYVGHHMKSVKGYPELASDPFNIQFLTPKEHLLAHGGNWRNITHGRYMP